MTYPKPTTPHSSAAIGTAAHIELEREALPQSPSDSFYYLSNKLLHLVFGYGINIFMETSNTLTAELTMLRTACHAAMLARDAIDNPCSSEWLAAHERYKTLCIHEGQVIQALANNPATRYGTWRTSNDVVMMDLGYL